MCYNLDSIINFCEAVGVVGSFVIGLFQYRRQNKQIISLKEKQLSAEYMPNLQIDSYSGGNVISWLEICLKNKSIHNVKLIEIKDYKKYLQKDRNLPYCIAPMEEYKLYIKEGYIEMPKDFSVDLILEDDINRKFILPIVSKNGKIVTKGLSTKNEVCKKTDK